MADIVASLFGVTPELYQQAQARRADEQALQFAKLSPFEKASFGIGRGAYQLAGALGGQDPQLQLISARNAIARQINYNDPESIQQGVQQLAQAGDTVGAMQLATVARDLELKQAQTAQASAAARRERVQATPEKIQLAREFAVRKGEPGTPEYEAEFNAQLTRLTTTDRSTDTPEMRNAAALAALKGAPGTPEYNTEYTAQLSRLTAKTERDERFGVEREAISMEVYNKPFSQLTQTERAAVNKRVEEEGGRKAERGAPKFELPGQKSLVDIPAFRQKVQATIKPQLDAITSADQALTAINDSLTTGNFVSFNAARVQLAKALGDSQLSRRDVEQAGGDPSILGRLTDTTSTLFTGTPTADTQKKIRNTLTAIRTVAEKKARGEIGVQRDIALRSPGYDAAAVERALAFPELSATPAAAAQPPIYARNPKTNERIMSTDGGVNWVPAPR